ncbi:MULTISPECIES: purine-nucleoside phosphorylase [Fusobacterium]|uniref:purine-nucleoside phosphorylase n=1 Tax=Fusobacterium TaxID=848 RepID=UPI001F28BDEE|nr:MULTISPECIES: purine-nucleoside phosphorylase [Fusobacterium]MCF2611997.1 purine-nucleoside phosphorylase [Fusobacterium perfoetens]MDY2980010.1 purine-nucleoside phosphorylase [Fusobacterium sp.]
MPTPHNQAKVGDIAKNVLMPGDPLRAKFIAETFLTNVRLVNSVRNMLAFTGEYKGKEITVMASGMGMPSIGIYSYELYSQYGVENIVRVGSAGAYAADLDIYDVVLADSAWSQSTFAKTQNGYSEDKTYPSEELNNKIIETAKRLEMPLHVRTIHSSDVFYTEESVYEEIRDKHNCACVEMESFALFHNAKVLGKNAACLLTISDSFTSSKQTTPEERQTAFVNMMKIALETFC